MKHIERLLENSERALASAEVLLNDDDFNGSVSRSYYAMFYALLALLATRQLGTSKHSSALSLFDREFVKPGHFPRDLSRSLRLAFNLRQTYDYGELVETDRLTAEQRLADARVFVEAIETYLITGNYLNADDNSPQKTLC